MNDKRNFYDKAQNAWEEITKIIDTLDGIKEIIALMYPEGVKYSYNGREITLKKYLEQKGILVFKNGAPQGELPYFLDRLEDHMTGGDFEKMKNVIKEIIDDIRKWGEEDLNPRRY